jgi:hypothetical protein
VQPPYWGNCRKMDFGQLRQFIDDSLRQLSAGDLNNDHPHSKEEFLNLLEMLRKKISASGLPKISPDPGNPPFPKYRMSKQLQPLYAQREQLRVQLTAAHSNLQRKKGRKRRTVTDRSIIKKQIRELQSKLGP